MKIINNYTNRVVMEIDADTPMEALKKFRETLPDGNYVWAGDDERPLLCAYHGRAWRAEK